MTDILPKRLKQRTYDMYIRGGLDPEIKVALEAEFEQVDELERVVLDDDGFVEFLADYINEESTKFAAYDRGEPRDHPHDGERSDPLCTCPDRYCPLKEARLPRPIRAADDPQDAIRRFKHDHAGDPLVLGDALDRYDEMRAAYKQHFRRIYVCCQHEIHPDELDELDGRVAASEAEDEPETEAVQA